MEIKVIASGSKGNCYLIDDKQSQILLDAGVPIKQIQIGCGFKVSALSGALISHSHMDHCKAVKDLARLGVDIFGSAATFDAIGINGHRLHVVSACRKYEVGSWVVMPFDLVHDVPNLGYLLDSVKTGERLLYITDTMYCPYGFSGVTHMMVEANYDNGQLRNNMHSGIINRSLGQRVMRTHMSIETLLGLLDANDLSKLQQVYLIHLSDDNSLADSFKDVVQRATGAEVIVCGHCMK